MMFGSKSKGVFIDVGDDFALIARTNSPTPPFAIEELRQIRLENMSEAAEQIKAIASGKGTGGYSQAVCGVHPVNRLVSRLTIEPRRFRDPGYLEEQIEEYLKVKASAYSLFTLSAVDGSDVSLQPMPPKDVLVCGASTEEMNAQQERLLELGLYPERMELATVATVGGVMASLAFSDAKATTLMLEIGAETTNVFVLNRDGIEVTRSVAFGVKSVIPLVQRELALKDEAAAAKLFFSNTFDFTGMAPQLLRGLIRELQASIGFYEVQTGQTVNNLCCTSLPSGASWLESAVSGILGMKAYAIDHFQWLGKMGIQCLPGVDLSQCENYWVSLFSLMGDFHPHGNETAA